MYVHPDYLRHRLRHIAELEEEIERLRFFAWSLAVILLATILTIAVVK